MTDRQILQLLYIRLKCVNEAIRLLEGYQSMNNRRARAVRSRRRSVRSVRTFGMKGIRPGAISTGNRQLRPVSKC